MFASPSRQFVVWARAVEPFRALDDGVIADRRLRRDRERPALSLNPRRCRNRQSPLLAPVEGRIQHSHIVATTWIHVKPGQSLTSRATLWLHCSPWLDGHPSGRRRPLKMTWSVCVFPPSKSGPWKPLRLVTVLNSRRGFGAWPSGPLASCHRRRSSGTIRHVARVGSEAHRKKVGQGWPKPTLRGVSRRCSSRGATWPVGYGSLRSTESPSKLASLTAFSFHKHSNSVLAFESVPTLFVTGQRVGIQHALEFVVDTSIQGRFASCDEPNSPKRINDGTSREIPTTVHDVTDSWTQAISGAGHCSRLDNRLRRPSPSALGSSSSPGFSRFAVASTDQVNRRLSALRPLNFFAKSVVFGVQFRECRAAEWHGSYSMLTHATHASGVSGTHVYHQPCLYWAGGLVCGQDVFTGQSPDALDYFVDLVYKVDQ